jgi:hypothetical protein
MVKTSKIFSLVFLSTLLILSTLSFVVEAQTDATVNILQSTGGTTDPAPGTTTYPDGTQVTFTATPDDGNAFVNWVISTPDGDATSTDNPLTMPVVGGVEYTILAQFMIIQPLPGLTLPSNLGTAAIIVVLASAGGSTNPAPGTYALADAANFNLQATAQSGWQFSHWTICGTITSHGNSPVNLTPTDNPYNVNHGYGSTYYYQAVFVPIGTSNATPAPTTSAVAGGMSNETLIIIGLAIVIVVILIGFGVYIAKLKKHP